MSQADAPGALQKLDDLMAREWWLPRALPYLVYVLLLTPVVMARDADAWLYPPSYVIQCAIVAWLLWRYRHRTPELTIRFHWLAIPTGVLVAVIWVALGKAMVAWQPDALGQHQPHAFEQMSPEARLASLALRVVGMSVLVPLFEELFIRSLLLRMLHSGRRTWMGLVQVACDLPLLGEWLVHTSLAQRAQAMGPVFEKQFFETPLGRLSVFGVTASTVLFTLGHAMRDWPGAIICGVVYCLLLRATAHRGLGPVVWAHGLTNLLLFIYVVTTGDWQFL